MRVTIPNTPSNTVVRVVRNNENIVWPTSGGSTWQAFPFEIDEVVAESKGEIPRVDVRVSNINRTMESYVLAYDNYVKTYGYAPITVDLYVLNSKNLVSATAEVEHTFELKQPKTNAQWATFTLGASNPYNKRFPPDRVLKNHCRFRWKDNRCKFTGSTPGACDKTFTACGSMMWAASSYGNTGNYGGFPGVGLGGLRVR